MQGTSGELPGTIRALLRGVQSRHVRRLDQLRERLQEEIFQWDHGALADSLLALQTAGRELIFSDLRPPLLQRLLGRHRAGFNRFAAAVDHMDGAAGAARRRAQELEAAFKEHHDAVRRLFVEFDLECKELSTELEKGVTLLQEMCEDINVKRQQGSRDPQLATLAETAQVYTQDFKDLQAISALVRDIGVRGNAILDRRAALLAQARAQMDHLEKQWNACVGEIAAAVRAGHTRVQGIPKAIGEHEEAIKRLDAAIDACGALQGEELFMADQLEALRSTLLESHAKSAS